MKKLKKPIQIGLAMLGLLFSLKSVNAQSISTHYFGQNAWMPYAIGTNVLNGKLDQHWADIKNSFASTVRYGGITVDKNMSTNAQYINMIDSIRSRGMEPIIQVPFNNNQFSAQQAAAIVTYINITKARNIKYWVIGNEPDLKYSYTTSAQIAAYYKPFASAMKNVDPSILIVGPEIASFNKTIIDGITAPNGPDDITGKDANGRYYLDVITFHTYPFNGSQTRAAVISKLGPGNSLDANLVYLNGRVAAANSSHGRTGASALKTAITEANIDWQNSSTDNLNGVGACSFLGGQFVAEMMGVGLKNSLDFINLWSVIEGSSTALNIGYLDRTTGAKKPLYYHFKLMAENFRGNYVGGTTNQANVKSFGSQDAQGISVLILNEDLTNNYNFTVRLNTAATAATSTLKININAGLAKEYTGVINNQSTTLLKFDGSGNIIEKIEYKLAGHADANLPPTKTVLSSAPIATIIPAGPTSFCTGGSVVLNANIISGYTYQWKKDNVVISGATGSSYTATASGSYTVVETSGSIINTSAAQVITVTPVPTAIVTAGGPTSFTSGGSVVLTGSAGTGYTYQWIKDGVNISGATSASYTSTLAGGYQVKITQNSCTALSASTVITILPTATITPAGPTSFCVGGSVVLNANIITGYTYQWKKDNVAISGATTSSYTATTSGSYTVVETSGSIINTSAAQVITVTPVPTAIITAGGPTSFTAGGSVVLTASTGTGYTYQWIKDGVNISAATSVSYTATLAGNYQVKIIQNSCTALSASTVITIIAVVATITPAGPISFCTGGSVKLNANVITGYAYQWKKNNVVISGATASSYTATASGSYTVTITSGGFTNTSAAVVISVLPLVATIKPLGATTMCSGSVGLQANTGSGFVYQWKKNNVAIPGATNALYAASTSGSYQIKITQGSCVAWSAPIDVRIQSGLSASITPDGPTTFCSGGKVILYANTCPDYVYQWKKDGVNINGATSPSYTATISGSYQIKITQQNLKNWSAPLNVTVTNCGGRESEPDSISVSSLSIDENSTDNKFEINVFPNPTNGNFTVELNTENSEQKNIEIQLFNFMGQEMYHKTFNFMDGKEKIELGENMARGVYILRATSGDKIATKRIILND